MKRFYLCGFFALIWLVVLLSPPLRLLFQVQLGGSVMQKISALPAPEDAPNFWEKTARRFPADKNVLTQAALEYPIDESLAKNEEDADEDDFEDVPPPVLASPGGEAARETFGPPGPNSQIFPGKTLANPNRERLRRLDWLVGKFPNDATLIALRLRASFEGFVGGRVGGEMSDPKMNGSQPAGYVSPEVSEHKPNFSPADYQKVFALCARGRKLDAGNGFFDWVECYFLIYAWRDGQAFQALDAVAAKKRFDDYALKIQQTKYAALETALGRHLLVEEKIEDIYSSSFNLHARNREMARILAWQSVKAQRKGDHQKCLRIAASLARASARMRENARTYIDGLVAAAIEAIAWSAPLYDARMTSRNRGRRTTPGQRLSSFQTYAAKYGRPELAAEAGRNYAASAAFRTAAMTNIQNNGAYGAPFGVWILITLLWWSGVLLLLLFPLALVLPALMWLLGRAPRVRRILRAEHARRSGVLQADSHASGVLQSEIPDAREVWNGAWACGGVRALGTAFWGVITIGLCVGALMIGAGQSEQVWKSIADSWNAVVTQSGSYGGVEGIYYLMSGPDELPSQWRFVLALSPFVFGILFAFWRAAEWQKRQNGEANFSVRVFLKSLFKGRAWHSPSALAKGERDDFDVGGAALRLLSFVLMALLFCSWIYLAFCPVSDGTQSWLVPLVFVFLFSLGLASEHFANWRKRPRRAATIRYALRLLQKSLWLWLVVGSALYFASLCISLPLRGRIEARVNRIIEVGEMRATAGK